MAFSWDVIGLITQLISFFSAWRRFPKGKDMGSEKQNFLQKPLAAFPHVKPNDDNSHSFMHFCVSKLEKQVPQKLMKEII